MYSPLEEKLVSNYMDINYPMPDPVQQQPQEPSLDGVQLAMGGNAAGRKSDRPISDVPMALFDMGAGAARGAVAQATGVGGDIEMIGRGLRAVFNRPEDEGRISAFLRGMQEKTFLPTTERMGEILPPVVPAGAPDAQRRQGSAAYGQAFGELAPLPGGIEAGTAALKAGAKALAPKAGEMIIKATEKTGIPVRGLSIVEPNGKTLPIIAPTKVERQKNYKTWAEGADIKSDAGEPKVLYHATTHDFDTFSLQRANAENHYGKAFYLTDSVDDANANYAGVGPDLKQRIELRSERLADEFADMPEQDVMDTIESAGVDMKKYFTDGKTFADLDSNHTNEILMQVAEKELKGHDGMVMPVFAKMKNPVKVGTKDETVFSIESEFDEAGDLVDESGNGIDLINAIREVGDEYGVDVEDVIAKIADGLYDGLRAGDADKIMRENIYDVYTPDGEMAGPGQFISDVFQRMGFDGIEMNAEKYFGPRQGAWGGKIGGMEGVKGANHYILFDSKNIKSAIGNNGKFDPRDPNILHGIGAGTAATGATIGDKEQK